MYLFEIVFVKPAIRVIRNCQRKKSFCLYQPCDDSDQGIYFDGHECQNVVEYRKKMSTSEDDLEKFMQDYQSDNLDIVNQPNLETQFGQGQKKV